AAVLLGARPYNWRCSRAFVPERRIRVPVSKPATVRLIFKEALLLLIPYLFQYLLPARDKTLAQGPVLLERSGDYCPCRRHDLLFLNGRNRFRKAFDLGRQDALCIFPPPVT